jgi:hypothetical protein
VLFFSSVCYVCICVLHSCMSICVPIYQVLVYDVSGLFGSESASSSANANAASRWKRLALDKVMW